MTRTNQRMQPVKAEDGRKVSGKVESKKKAYFCQLMQDMNDQSIQ